MVAWEEDLKAKQAKGLAVRCSASASPAPDWPDRVHVLFEAGNSTIGKYMSQATYRAIPLGCNIEANATPEDYAQFGLVVDGPPTYEYGAITKQVS